MKFFLFYITFLPLILSAKISGHVYDSTDNPLPYASIVLESRQLGTMTDKDGYFELPMPNSYLPDSITINYVGYFEKKVFVKNDTSLSITLEELIFEIKEANVVAFKAETILKVSLSNIDSFYSNKTHHTNGYYTQIHKEDGKHVRYIEAFASVEHKPYSSRNIDEQKQRFNIIELRKSYNYERNGEQHGDHIMDLMAENPLLNTKGSILNENNLAEYNINYDIEFDSTGYTQLLFQNKAWNLDKNYSGKILINNDDFAITAITIYSFPNTRTTHEEKSDWHFQNGAYNIQFEKIENIYKMTACTMWYNHHIVSQFGDTDYVIEEFFDWKTAHFLAPNNLKYIKHGNLYSMTDKYDPDFWKDRPIDKVIIDDLSEYKSLEEQFADY